jgi:hypothetical protein
MLHQLHQGLTGGKQILDKFPEESPEWARSVDDIRV